MNASSTALITNQARVSQELRCYFYKHDCLTQQWFWFQLEPDEGAPLYSLN